MCHSLSLLSMYVDILTLTNMSMYDSAPEGLDHNEIFQYFDRYSTADKTVHTIFSLHYRAIDVKFLSVLQCFLF